MAAQDKSPWLETLPDVSKSAVAKMGKSELITAIVTLQIGKSKAED